MDRSMNEYRLCDQTGMNCCDAHAVTAHLKGPDCGIGGNAVWSVRRRTGSDRGPLVQTLSQNGDPSNTAVFRPVPK